MRKKHKRQDRCREETQRDEITTKYPVSYAKWPLLLLSAEPDLCLGRELKAKGRAMGSPLETGDRNGLASVAQLGTTGSEACGSPSWQRVPGDS